MKFSTYFQTLQGALAENRIWRTVALGLVLANVLLIVAVVGKRETVVLVPPTLSAESRVASDQADAATKEAWGLYIVMQIANVTPRTVDYIGNQVGKSIAPAAYTTFMQGLAEQAKQIKEDNLTIQFAPTHTFYVAEKGIVVVSGEHTVRGMRGAERKTVRTYELGLSVSNYRVVADSIRTYDGPWKPLREEQEREEERKRALEQRQATLTTAAR